MASPSFPPHSLTPARSRLWHFTKHLLHHMCQNHVTGHQNNSISLCISSIHDSVEWHTCPLSWGGGGTLGGRWERWCPGSAHQWPHWQMCCLIPELACSSSWSEYKLARCLLEGGRGANVPTNYFPCRLIPLQLGLMGHLCSPCYFTGSGEI